MSHPKITRKLVDCDIKRLKTVFKTLRIPVRIIVSESGPALNVIVLDGDPRAAYEVAQHIERMRHQETGTYIRTILDTFREDERKRKAVAQVNSQKRRELHVKFGPIAKSAYRKAVKHPNQPVVIKGTPTPYWFVCLTKLTSTVVLVDEEGTEVGTAYTLEGAEHLVPDHLAYVAGLQP